MIRRRFGGMFLDVDETYPAMTVAICRVDKKELDHQIKVAKSGDSRLERLRDYLTNRSYELLGLAVATVTNELNEPVMCSIVDTLLKEAENCGVLNEMLSHDDFTPFWDAVKYTHTALAAKFYHVIADAPDVSDAEKTTMLQVMLNDDAFVGAINTLFSYNEDFSDLQLIGHLYAWKPELFKQENIDRVDLRYRDKFVTLKGKVTALRRSAFDMSRQIGGARLGR